MERMYDVTLLSTDVGGAYVRPPRPIAVKKFMANRVFFGSSRGISPS